MASNGQIRGFLIDGKLALVLAHLPSGRRAAVLDHAFALSFGIEQQPPSDPMDEALAIAVAEVADDFEGRRKEPKTAKTGAQRTAEYRGRKRVAEAAAAGDGVTKCDARVTKCDECDACDEDVTVTPKTDRQTDRQTECDNRHTCHTPTVDQVTSYAAVHFSAPVPPPDFCAEFVRRMTEGSWKDSRGRSLLVNAAWQRELSAWWANEKKISARAPLPDRRRVTGSGQDTHVMTAEEYTHVE